MSEIANDSGMSAANLYRYFDNKQEIVVECASRAMNDRLDRLREITDRGELSAGAKLKLYARELVEDNHDLIGDDSMVGELVDNITRERPQVVHDKNEIHYDLLSQILAEGNANGEFSVSDCNQCARHIHSAMMLFDVPLFVGFYSRAEFMSRADGVIDLLLNGLRKHSEPPSAASE